MIKSYCIFVKGKVQGVYYRANTLRQALNLNIKGFVKNMPDGSVYIEAEGEEKNLNKFINWCKTGPEQAIVSSIEKKESIIKDFKDFLIERQ